MPKVSRLTVKFPDGPKQYDIYYSRSDKFHIKGFPDNIARYAQNIEGMEYYRRFDTEVGLVEYYQKLVQRYFDDSAKSRKVIMLELGLSQKITYKQHESHWRTVQHAWFEKISKYIQTIGSHKFALGLEFETGVIVSAQKEVFYTCKFDAEGNEVPESRNSYGSEIKDGSGYFSDSDKRIILDYTPEAVLFLEDIQNRLAEMGKKLALFLTDKEKLTKAIQENTKLLLN